MVRPSKRSAGGRGAWLSPNAILTFFSRQNHELEAHYAVPPHWSNPPERPRQHNRLQMVGTSMIEPDCPNQWCRTQSSVKWSGPGEKGFWIDPTGAKHPFEPEEVEYNDEL